MNADEVVEAAPKDPRQETSTLSARLKYLGPYPALSLRFPDASTSSQRERNVTGVSLDFVLDTAANTNTLNGQVAQELQLDIVGEALPGMSASGAFEGGHTYELGDAQLEGILREQNDLDLDEDSDEPLIFMQNLTASALPIASPASAGLLSLAFFYCFEGGVEFNWGSANMQDGMMTDEPSITFFGEKDESSNNSIAGMSCVTIDPVPVTQLPSIKVKVNGLEIPALLDTGSPITVLNSQAAELAGITTMDLANDGKKSKNPFAAAMDQFKEAKAMAQAAASGDILTIGGMNGPVNLLRSTSPVSITADATLGSDTISLGEGKIFVGDIPGLAALGGLGVDAPPALVLGMDVLRQKPRMVLRARDNEVYF